RTLFDRYRAHRHLHSSPTRRSSDLPARRSTPPAAAVDSPAIGSSACAEIDPSYEVAPESAVRLLRLRGDRPQSRSASISGPPARSEEHTSELQSRENLVCRLLLEKK